MVIRRIYFQFYVWGCRYNYANSPELSAMYMIALLLTLDCVGLELLFHLVVGSKVTLREHKLIYLFICAIFAFIIYIMYVKSGKYKIIETQFKEKSVKERRKILILSCTFILFSILFPTGIAIFIGYILK